MKILMVEDEDSIREPFAGMLRRRKHTVFETGLGKEAIDIIEKEKPDMVYLDISLKDEVSGMDVLKQCKPKFPEVEIVMMSAYVSEYQADAMSLGAFAFVKKPISKVEDFFGPLEAIKQKKGL